MNKLVYVQFNARLMNKKKRRSDKVDALLANTAHNAQSWIVDGLEDEEVTPGSGLTWEMVGEASGANEELQPRRSARNVEDVREPEEDDFVSDGTEDEGDDNDDEEFDFESDKERDVGVGHEDMELDVDDWL